MFNSVLPFGGKRKKEALFSHFQNGTRTLFRNYGLLKPIVTKEKKETIQFSFETYSDKTKERNYTIFM